MYFLTLLSTFSIIFTILFLFPSIQSWIEEDKKGMLMFALLTLLWAVHLILFTL